MAFSITNVGKAEGLLKKGGFDVSGMEKGTIGNLTLDDDQIMKIVKRDKNNLFDVLNSSGKLLKNSLLTRSTGHKTNDFSSIQSISSVRVELLYRNLKDAAKKQNSQQKGWNDLDKKVKDEIEYKAKSKFSSIRDDLKKFYKRMRMNHEFKENMEEFLDKNPSEQLDILNKAVNTLHEKRLLSEHITISKDFSHDIGIELSKEAVLYGGLFGGISGVGFGVPLGLTFIIGGTAVATGVATLGAGLGIAALLLVPAAILYLKTDSLGAIFIKRHWISMQNDYLKIIKKLDGLLDYIESEIYKYIEKTHSELKIDKSMVDIINNFLEAQGKDWDLYTDAVKRDYYNAKDKSEEGTHTSGIRIRLDNKKTHTIGKLKESIAKQWTKISLSEDMKKIADGN